MNKNKLLQQIAEFNEISAALEKECRKYCADETISVLDRWEVFQDAPNKDHDCCYDLPPDDLLGFEIVAYDDLYLERGATWNVVDSINDWQDDFDSVGIAEIGENEIGQLHIDLLKNYYMVQYKGSWINDW